MINNETESIEKLHNDPFLFCSRGFNSLANPLSSGGIGTSFTPFTSIGSIDVYTNSFNNPRILIDLSAFIESTLLRTDNITNGKAYITLVFRISKSTNGGLMTTSPDFLYSKNVDQFVGSSDLNQKIADSFEFQFCDPSPCEPGRCITYVVEYSATLSTIAVGVAGSLISLSTSISNITLTALVFDISC